MQIQSYRDANMQNRTEYDIGNLPDSLKVRITAVL